MPRVLDSCFYLLDGAVHRADGAFAMTAFIGCGVLQITACGSEVIERRHHVRLRGMSAAGDEASGQEDDEGDCGKYGTVSHGRLLS
jgi:hypothetical protein